MILHKIQEAKTFLQSRCSLSPQMAIVFGSALGEHFLSRMKILQSFAFEEIPHFKKSTVLGHPGRLHFGYYQKTPLLVSEGRLHSYEGYSMEEVVFPIQVYASLQVTTLIVTNAAGALNPLYQAGDLVLICDHINGTGQNPLRGTNEETLGPRFVNMSEVYDASLIHQLSQSAKRAKTRIRKGVYLGITGPSYETPAEIRMYRQWGADMVGMSTVPEVIAARYRGMKVAGISCMTNLLSPKKKNILSHEHVVKEAKKFQKKLSRLLEEFCG